MSRTADEPVELTLVLHQQNYRNLQQAAERAGLDVSEFCVLAIHRESRRIVTGHRRDELLPRQWSSMVPRELSSEG